MSRIIRNLIQSAKNRSKIDSAVVFFHPVEADLEILNLNSKLYSLQEHPSDTNKKLNIIDNNTIQSNLSFIPDVVISCSFANYGNAKNLAGVLRLPLVNIIRKLEGLKTETAFDLSRNQMINDINLVIDATIAEKLFLFNYEIIQQDLNQQILNSVNKYIP